MPRTDKLRRLDVGEGRQQLAATQAQRGSMAVTASAMAIAATPPRASGSGETGDPPRETDGAVGAPLTEEQSLVQ